MTLDQRARGGDGGESRLGQGGRAGHGRSSLTVSDGAAASVSGAVLAEGGYGGHSYETLPALSAQAMQAARATQATQATQTMQATQLTRATAVTAAAPPSASPTLACRGGNADSVLNLSSTRAGAAVSGSSVANGGTGGYNQNGYIGVGGDASALANVHGKGHVVSSAAAAGGVAIPLNAIGDGPGGIGGNAHAQALATAQYRAVSGAQAMGGQGAQAGTAAALSAAATTLHGGVALASAKAAGISGIAQSRATSHGAWSGHAITSQAGASAAPGAAISAALPAGAEVIGHGAQGV